MCRHFIEPFALVEVQVLVNLVTANRIVPHLLAGADAALPQAPVNVLRLSLRPKGLAPKIPNLTRWRAHRFERLRQKITVTAAPVRVDFLNND